mmetsp:Transcript_9746/g.39914  ORF Transcript_9746/g.39914 Transcript_9746/m.39914 type:complete len:496 (-) Transcript_9746:5999-7486(-)
MAKGVIPRALLHRGVRVGPPLERVRARAVTAAGLRAHQLAQDARPLGRIVAGARRRRSGKFADVGGGPAARNFVVARRAVELAVRAAVPGIARARRLASLVRGTFRSGVITRGTLDVAEGPRPALVAFAHSRRVAVCVDGARGADAVDARGARELARLPEPVLVADAPQSGVAVLVLAVAAADGQPQGCVVVGKVVGEILDGVVATVAVDPTHESRKLQREPVLRIHVRVLLRDHHVVQTDRLAGSHRVRSREALGRSPVQIVAVVIRSDQNLGERRQAPRHVAEARGLPHPARPVPVHGLVHLREDVPTPALVASARGPPPAVVGAGVILRVAPRAGEPAAAGVSPRGVRPLRPGLSPVVPGLERIRYGGEDRARRRRVPAGGRDGLEHRRQVGVAPIRNGRAVAPFPDKLGLAAVAPRAHRRPRIRSRDPGGPVGPEPLASHPGERVVRLAGLFPDVFRPIRLVHEIASLAIAGIVAIAGIDVRPRESLRDRR